MLKVLNRMRSSLNRVNIKIINGMYVYNLIYCLFYVKHLYFFLLQVINFLLII